ncbi:hypothetical protein T484DRAFT_1915996 [Baffinella frigidus]|nr:hypothetical protein T484DRAFT_1915996 [Cryptophyta sp. CCMP2293]
MGLPMHHAAPTKLAAEDAARWCVTEEEGSALSLDDLMALHCAARRSAEHSDPLSRLVEYSLARCRRASFDSACSRESAQHAMAPMPLRHRLVAGVMERVTRAVGIVQYAYA